MWWGNDSKDDLPADTGEVDESLSESNLIDDEIVLVNAWAEFDRVLELRSNCPILSLHEVVHQLSMVILLLLSILILDDGNRAHVLFGDLYTLRLSLLKLHLEHDVMKFLHHALLFNIHIILINFIACGFSRDLLNHLVIYKTDHNCLFIFVVIALNLLVLWKIVVKLSGTIVGDSSSTLLCELLSFNHAANFTI